MSHFFVGRTKEIKKLNALKKSKRAEFVAIYGRRRVGKTELVRIVFNNDFSFLNRNFPTHLSIFNF